MTGSRRKLTEAFSRYHWLLQWIIFSFLAILIYGGIIGDFFVNDDFIVLNKVCLQKQLNTDGFFRPLSDISIYINYLFSGLNPIPYRITSILIHALNAVLLFRFFARCPWTTDESIKKLAASLAALLFLIYPFHNEPVVWLLGRAALLASTFAFLALAALASSWRDAIKMPVVAICYFIAMTGYETVMVLPAIILVWLLAVKAPVKKIATWMGILAVVFVIHFIIRVQVSGSATGEYGARLIQWDIRELLSNAVKVAARMLAPPENDPDLFSIYAGFAGVLAIGALVWFWRKTAAQKNTRTWFLALAGMLFFALLVPIMFSVSTRTSESDRLLYFPSFFFCAIFALVVLTLFYISRWLQIVFTLVLVYSFVFLQQNHRNWLSASRAVTGLLDIVKAKPATGKLYIVHMPGDIKGAYVFRVGFREALIVNKLDTTGIVVFNHFELQYSPQPIDHQMLPAGLLIPPDILIQRNGHIPGPGASENNYKTIFVHEADRVVYWNRYKWVGLDTQPLFK